MRIIHAKYSIAFKGPCVSSVVCVIAYRLSMELPFTCVCDINAGPI